VKTDLWLLETRMGSSNPSCSQHALSYLQTTPWFETVFKRACLDHKITSKCNQASEVRTLRTILWLLCLCGVERRKGLQGGPLNPLELRHRVLVKRQTCNFGIFQGGQTLHLSARLCYFLSFGTHPTCDVLIRTGRKRAGLGNNRPDSPHRRKHSLHLRLFYPFLHSAKTDEQA
jgi:hypothetical protein